MGQTSIDNRMLVSHDPPRSHPATSVVSSLCLLDFYSSLSCQPTSQWILLSAVRCITILFRPYPLHPKGYIFVSCCTKLWAPIDSTTWHPESRHPQLDLSSVPLSFYRFFIH